MAPFTNLALRALGYAQTISVTPHDSYSSSVGVLGCKINTNRVAYWPLAVGCDDLCVKVTNGDRSLNLLRVDQSGGAYDISYDAWNYLSTGQSATVNPTSGGGISMQYETVDMSECSDLFLTDDKKLPLEAANSMNYVASCTSQASSWVAQNYDLYNIANAVCTLGVDEKCTLDLAVSNQPSCPSQLGLQTPLSEAVKNIQYGTGTVVAAVQ